MNDRISQKEELEVLESIYPDILYVEGEHKISLRFRADIKLSIFLPDRYPSEEPPIYELSGPSLKAQERMCIQNVLNDSYAANIGMPVLFTWITAISDYLEVILFATLNKEVQEFATESDSIVLVSGNTKNAGINDLSLPEIKHGKVFTDRKSHFQAHLARIHHKEQYCNASHFYPRQHDCEDDGETGASSRMLELLNKMGAENVMVVVTRWYGGIHLGPDRFRIINNLTREIVAEHGLDIRL
uniref:RWD domain-containing protein n=1 Tax=Heterorhabditis bacteriophora TaxID=37862 RepID=A0A1I7XVB7_HETBA